MSIQVGPHEFRPLKWHDRLFAGGRCSSCYFPKATHPILAQWSEARPIEDHTRLTYREALRKELAAVSKRTKAARPPEGEA